MRRSHIGLWPPWQVGDRSQKWAKSFCASEGGGGARLVTVQSAAKQTALEEYLSRQNAFDLATLEYLWLDGSDEQYDPHLPGNNTYDSSVFCWGQNERNQSNFNLLTFTNWAAGQPVKPPPPLKNNATCIQLHADCGKWSNEPCSKANAVVCLRRQRWSPEKVQEVVEKLVESQINSARLSFILKKLQKTNELLQEYGRQSKETNEQLQKTIEQLQEEGRKNMKTNEKMQREIEKLTKSPVPLGFIYVQLPKEKSPQEIWSSEIKWTDVSSTYECIFFRVVGSKTQTFGKVQEDFLPYIDKVSYFCQGKYGTNSPCSYVTEAHIPRGGGWSGDLYTAIKFKKPGNDNQSISFHFSGGEVRPRNMAVRVWKRTE